MGEYPRQNVFQDLNVVGTASDLWLVETASALRRFADLPGHDDYVIS